MPDHRDSFAETHDVNTIDESLESRANDLNSLNHLNDSLNPLNGSNSLNESNSSNPLNESNSLNPLVGSNSSNPLNESNSLNPLIDSNRSVGSAPSTTSWSADPDKRAQVSESSELKDSMSSLDASGRSDILRRVGAIPQNGMDGHEALDEAGFMEEKEEEESDEKKMDSFSSDDSDSSRNTLQSPSEERDRRVEMLKIEIEEIKKEHETQLNSLRAQLDQLLIRYMAIEQSLCGVCEKTGLKSLLRNSPFKLFYNSSLADLIRIERRASG